MFYEVIIKNEAGMQVYKFSSKKEATGFANKYFGIKKPVLDIVTIGKFQNQVLIQRKCEEIPEQRVYWEDAA